MIRIVRFSSCLKREGVREWHSLGGVHSGSLTKSNSFYAIFPPPSKPCFPPLRNGLMCVACCTNKDLLTYLRVRGCSNKPLTFNDNLFVTGELVCIADFHLETARKKKKKNRGGSDSSIAHNVYTLNK